MWNVLVFVLNGLLFLLKGLSLILLIRWLGIMSDGIPGQERQQARRVAAQAALNRLQELAGQEWVPETRLMNLRARYEEKARHAVGWVRSCTRPIKARYLFFVSHNFHASSPAAGT